MTTAEAAKAAKYTVKGIQSAIHRGHLHAVKVGRDWNIAPDDFDKWLAAPKSKGGRPRKDK